MKEFIEKLIEKLEEERHPEICGGFETMRIDRAISIINQLAEGYKGGWIEELLEAKKNCEEDSDCSECPFGQIEDRCVLQEMQIKKDNNDCIPCSERLPNVSRCRVTVKYDMEVGNPVYDTLDAYFERYKGGYIFKDNWMNDITNNVIAWQPLPEPYQQKGE